MASSNPPLSNMAKIAMLLFASMAIAIGNIHPHFLGAMVAPLGKAYGWSRGDIAFALTIATIIYPFTTIAAGMLADRYPIRWIVLPGICLFAVGTALLGLAGGALWTWYAGYAAFSIASIGLSVVLFTKLIVLHFSTRRGLALAAALAGSGLLISFVPHIVLALEQSVGIKGIYPVLAVCAFGLLIVPSLLFLPREGRPAAQKSPAVESSSGWREIAGSPVLWRLGIAFMLIGACIGIFIVHLQPILTDAGLTRSQAASVALFVGPALIVGRLGTGALYDILPARLVTMAAFSLPAFAYVWLLFLPVTPANAWALAAITGLAMGSETDAVAYLCSRYFKPNRYGLAFSITVSLYGAGIGVASWLIGEAFDATGSYNSVFIALSAAVIVAIALVVSLGPPRLKVDGS